MTTNTERDRLPREIGRGVAHEGRVSVVGGDRDQPGGAPSREVLAHELSQWNELSHDSGGLDERAEFGQ